MLNISKSWTNKYDAVFSESTNPVNCGNHRAPSCEECSRGHGATWCAGDCKWDSNRNSCRGKCHDNIFFQIFFLYLGSHPKYLSILNWRYTYNTYFLRNSRGRWFWYLLQQAVRLQLQLVERSRILYQKPRCIHEKVLQKGLRWLFIGLWNNVLHIFQNMTPKLKIRVVNETFQ